MRTVRKSTTAAFLTLTTKRQAHARVPFYFNKSPNLSSETKQLIKDVQELQTSVNDLQNIGDHVWNAAHLENRIKTIFMSNSLDGGRLTLEEVSSLVRTGHVSLATGQEPKHLKYYVDVLNHIDVIDHLVQDSQPTLEISQQNLKKLHSMFLARYPTDSNNPSAIAFGLASNIKSVKPGCYRQTNVSLWGNDSVIDMINPFNIQSQMEQLVDYTNEAEKTCDPIVFSSAVYLNMLRIQPFGEANGRVARLLANGVLKKRAGFWFLTPFSELEHVALENSFTESSLDPFVHYVASSLSDNYTSILQLIKSGTYNSFDHFQQEEE